MPLPSLEEPSQLAPSQFAYFKTVHPSTTASGVVPGQALLDTPPLDRSPSPPLERSQRKRKPSARKAQGEAVQPSTSKPQSKKRAQPSASKRNGKGARSTSNAGTSKSATIAGLQIGGTEMANRGGAEVEYPEAQDGNDSRGEETEYEGEDETVRIDPTIIEELESLLGHSVAHLSHRQIKDLLDRVLETQAPALGTQVQPVTAIAQSLAGVGLASGDRNGSPSNADSGEIPLPQQQKSLGSNEGPLTSQKRRLDVPASSGISKRARMAAGQDTATESESDDNSDTPRRRASSSDSDSVSEAVPPLPRPPRKSRGTPLRAARPKPTTTVQSFLPAVHPPVVPLAKSPPNASTTTHLARHPPPTDINDNQALITWALKIVDEQARQLNPNLGTSNPGPSRPQQPDHPSATTTATLVSQAIANHRAERASSSSQAATAITIASSASTPMPATETTPTSTLGGRKRKYRKKTKLADFSGPVGEIASAAIPYFLATIFAEGGYENLDTFQDWALDAYRRTWELDHLDQDDIFEPPPMAVLKIMIRRASWLRGEVKKRIRAVVEYGYGFRNPAVSRADIKHNRRLAKKLKPQVFHCKNLVCDTDQFEHPEFIRAIGAGLFWDSESLGAVFHDRFKPVPLPAVALILTMIQACIEEWGTGHYKAIELDVDTQQKIYTTHLLSLYAYENIAATRLTRFCGQWADAGLNYSGATLDQQSATAQAYVLPSNVRPDTPPPESEVDEHA